MVTWCFYNVRLRKGHARKGLVINVVNLKVIDTGDVIALPAH